MQNFNEVTLIGELTGNLKFSFNGDEPYLRFTLSTYEKLYNPLRKRFLPATELHSVIVYGELAIKLGYELSPGLQVYVRGKQKHSEGGNQTTEVSSVNSGTAFVMGGLVSKKGLKTNTKEIAGEKNNIPTLQSMHCTDLCVEERPRVAVICTGHINEQDALIMPELCWNSLQERGRYWIQNTPTGWLLRLNNCIDWEEELIQSGISCFAIHNLTTLKKSGFDWIHFDAGAQVVKGLNYWEW